MLLPCTPPYEECHEVYLYLTTLLINYYRYHLYLSKRTKYPCISVAAYLLQCRRVLYPLLHELPPLREPHMHYRIKLIDPEKIINPQVIPIVEKYYSQFREHMTKNLDSR